LHIESHVRSGESSSTNLMKLKVIILILNVPTLKS